MAIKVLIKRHIRESKSAEALVLINEIRNKAIRQTGYISGETLIDHYDERRVTVISTWRTIEEWIRWQESDERAAYEAKLEKILEGKTTFEIYDLGGSLNE